MVKNSGDWMEGEKCFDWNDFILIAIVLLAIGFTIWSFSFINNCNKVVDAERITANRIAMGLHE
jgi:hypothetical protein